MLVRFGRHQTLLVQKPTSAVGQRFFLVIGEGFLLFKLYCVQRKGNLSISFGLFSGILYGLMRWKQNEEEHKGRESPDIMSFKEIPK